MIYEIDFELSYYSGGDCALRFSPSIELQGEKISYLRGDYVKTVAILKRQFQKLEEAGAEVRVYIQGDFLDLDKSPVLKGFFDLKKNIKLRIIRNSLETKVD
jgi:hypothetical protein